MLANILRVMRAATSRWNPLDKGASVTVSSDGKTAGVSTGQSVRGTKSRSSGIVQFEITVGSITTFGALVGVATAGANINSYPGGSAGGWGYWTYNGQVYLEGTPVSYGASFTTGDTIGVLVNFNTGQLRFYKNGVDQGLASSALLGKTLFPIVGAAASDTTSSFFTINTGESPFSFPISGSSPWG